MTRTVVAPFVVRVLGPDGSVAGTGFLISGNTILTCAHVVSVAQEPGSVGRPRGYVPIDLPAFQQQRLAEVLPGGWFPEQGADLAVLRLHGPAIRFDPPILGGGEREATGDLPARWGLPSTEWSERAGFSGAPVLDPETGNVIGMVIGGRAGSPESPAGVLPTGILPVATIADYWPPLWARLTAAEPVGTSPVIASSGIADLPTRDVGAIVEALLDVPDLKDRQLRSVYVDALAGRAGVTPDLRRYDDARRDLWSLVSWCTRTFGGFRELVDVVREFHPASVEAETLAERVERVAPLQLLSQEERQTLRTLVRGARNADLRELYYSVTGPLSLAPVGGFSEPEGALWALEEALAPADGDPPLVEFVLRLAQGQARPLRSELYAWAEEFCRLRAIPVPPLAQLRTAPDHARAKAHALDFAAYLTFQLEEDGLSSDRFLLTGWLEIAGKPRVVLYSTDESLSLDEIRTQVARIIESEEGNLTARSDGLLIEFALPFSLLDEPVEEWQVESAGTREPVPLGRVFPVIIRSHDRFRDRRSHERWMGEWIRLTSGPTAGLPNLISGERPMIRAALRAGIPIALWRRGQAEPSEMAELEQILARTSLRDLPFAIRRMRRQAAAGAGNDDLARHLSLLWDDPRRIPQTSGYMTAPEVAEG